MNNNDLISRSALKAEAIEMEIFQPYGGDGSCMGVTVGMIDCAPAVDAEVVRHGYWIPQDNTRTKFMCSDCKSRNHDGSGKYCSLCGCKMDGGAVGD